MRHTVGHADQREANTVTIEEGEEVTLRIVLERILDAMVPSWIVTVFPDRVILYKEPTTYRYALESFTA